MPLKKIDCPSCINGMVIVSTTGRGSLYEPCEKCNGKGKILVEENDS